VIAQRFLSTPLLIVFLLAIVSAVLSTIVSAVMAPAAVLGHNLLEPLIAARWGSLTPVQSLRLQRLCVVLIAVAATALALSGAGAYELVEDAYAMSLVAMFVPFVAGLASRRPPPAAGLAALVVGISSWGVHTLLGWEHFLNSDWPVPHELIDTGLSGVAFGIACVGAGWLGVTAAPELTGRKAGRLVEAADGDKESAAPGGPVADSAALELPVLVVAHVSEVQEDKDADGVGDQEHPVDPQR
jgi:Na+/proline symporter